LKEDRSQRFKQIGFAATIGSGADEGREAFGLGQLVLQAPCAAEMMLKTARQAAKACRVSDLEAQQFHDSLTTKHTKNTKGILQETGFIVLPR
jgi:hypothetical protein